MYRSKFQNGGAETCIEIVRELAEVYAYIRMYMKSKI